MLTPKIIKETTEKFFQFDLDNDKSWNYIWYCYVRAPVHPLVPLSKGRGNVLIIDPYTGNLAGASHQLNYFLSTANLELLNAFICNPVFINSNVNSWCFFCN